MEIVQKMLDVGYSIIGWTLFFNFLTFILFPIINDRVESVKKWKKSQKKEVSYLASLDWDVRCSSILNAWVTFGLVVYALLFENKLSPWRIFDYSYYGVLAMRICGGYFINDFIVVIICRNYYPGVTDYIIHHVVAISGFILADVETGLIWFVNYRLLSELSTPFVNLRWMLLQVGFSKESILYKINRHLTFWAFLAARIIPMPFCWGFLLYHIYTGEYSKLMLFSQIHMIISGLALDFLNINWFVKLSKGMKIVKKGETNDYGQLKSEDPTEGSIFGRVNVKTKTLFDQMRKRSIEQIQFLNMERRKLIEATVGSFNKQKEMVRKHLAIPKLKRN